MKKIITPLFLLLFAYSSYNAQNVDDQKIIFRYFQLPSQPIKGHSFYTLIIDHTAYIKNNEDSLALYINNPNSYQAQMNRWLEDVKRIDKAYFLEMAKWEKATNAGQTLNQPLKQAYPPMPSITSVSSPILTHEISENLVNNQVAIGGMTKGFEGINVTLKPLGFQTASIKETKTGSAATTKYNYVANFKMPIEVTVEVPGQGVIYTEILYNTLQTQNINSYASKYEYEYWKVDNFEKFWETTQKTALNNALAAVNAKLNDMYGTFLATRNTDVYTVRKFQKFEYNDLIDAFTQIKQGYDKLFMDQSKSQALPYINNAIGIWESAINTGAVGGKKDRINDKVIALLYVNLAEAHMWTGNYTQAENYIMKAKNAGNLMSGTLKYKNEAERLQILVNDLKSRELANK